MDGYKHVYHFSPGKRSRSFLVDLVCDLIQDHGMSVDHYRRSWISPPQSPTGTIRSSEDLDPRFVQEVFITSSYWDIISHQEDISSLEAELQIYKGPVLGTSSKLIIDKISKKESEKDGLVFFEVVKDRSNPPENSQYCPLRPYVVDLTQDIAVAALSTIRSIFG